VRSFFPHSLDGIQKVVILSFPNLGIPLHILSLGNEEVLLLLVHALLLHAPFYALLVEEVDSIG